MYLNFYKKTNKEWKEWHVLSKASFAYKFHLLEEICLSVINYFYKWDNLQNLVNDEKPEFNIKFDEETGKKPDILISLGREHEEVGLEITEVYSHKNEEKGENQQIILMNKMQKILWEKIKNSKGKETEKILSETITNEKEGGLELLLENMKKRIEKKNSKLLKLYKTKSNSLWTILLASFPIYLCKITKEYGPRPLESEEKEMQKDYLYWYLLKRISEKLEDIKIEFDLLIITFLNSDYSSSGAFLSKHDPYNKKFHDAMLKKSLFLKHFKKESCDAVLPHFYIPIKEGKIELEKEIKRKEKEFRESHGCDANSIMYWQITSSTLFSYAMSFD